MDINNIFQILVYTIWVWLMSVSILFKHSKSTNYSLKLSKCFQFSMCFITQTFVKSYRLKLLISVSENNSSHFALNFTLLCQDLKLLYFHSIPLIVVVSNTKAAVNYVWMTS